MPDANPTPAELRDAIKQRAEAYARAHVMQVLDASRKAHMSDGSPDELRKLSEQYLSLTGVTAKQDNPNAGLAVFTVNITSAGVHVAAAPNAAPSAPILDVKAVAVEDSQPVLAVEGLPPLTPEYLRRSLDDLLEGARPIQGGTADA